MKSEVFRRKAKKTEGQVDEIRRTFSLGGAWQIDVIQSLHGRLRDATAVVHERMHGHDGFGAIKDGTIDKTSYIQLFCRLYGFLRPFERETGFSAVRSRWLGQDLGDLGLDDTLREKIPDCAGIPRLQAAHRRLGALYVVTGSALGGRQLARGLDHLFPPAETAGRRFFLGHGAQTGAVWRDYLAHLAAVPPDDTHTHTSRNC